MGDYYLAVWAGPSPASVDAACDYVVAAKNASHTPPTRAIVALVESLTKRFPDLTSIPDSQIDSVDTPWVDGPLIKDANGSFIYFGLTTDGAQRHLAEVVSIIREHKLNCFDPNLDQMCAG